MISPDTARPCSCSGSSHGPGPRLAERARSERPLITGLAVVAVVGSLVLAGDNIWPYASSWFVLTWSAGPPQIAGLAAPSIWLGVGGLLVLALFARSAWRRSGNASRGARTASRSDARAPLPACSWWLSWFSRCRASSGSAPQHRDSYTLASDAVATLGGEPCGLQRVLSVETDPAAGVLPVRSADGTLGVQPTPVDGGGTVMPGVAVVGTGTTDWFALDPAQRDGGLPVVVTLAGSARPGDQVTLEFADGDGVVDRRSLQPVGGDPRDERAHGARRAPWPCAWPSTPVRRESARPRWPRCPGCRA